MNNQGKIKLKREGKRSLGSNASVWHKAFNYLKNDVMKIEDKGKRIAAYRKEVSRLSALANKRIERLEKNELQDTPAYKQYITGGGHKFGVKGKTYNEVQQELSKLQKFLDSETSTVRGANKVLKDMASNIGIRYKNFKELKEKSKSFFTLASKVEEYLRNVEDMGSAIGYQQIWEAINTYTQTEKIELSESEDKIEEMTLAITKALKEFDEKLPILDNWYKLD